jgi:hypothetical protein
MSDDVPFSASGDASLVRLGEIVMILITAGMRAAATSTDLSIRQIQSIIAGRASRRIVGEITKDATVREVPTDKRITGKTALDLMRQQVTDVPSHGGLPWSVLLADRLIHDFPCAPS